MRISEYFGLDRSQSELDFVDVDTFKDVPVYIDPSCIRRLSDDWSHRCDKQLTTYFDSVLDAVRNDDDRRLMSLLSKLKEPNETHLGISKGKSAGRALGARSIRTLARKLAESKAARTGLIEDLEDTALFIDNVGKDVVSDITTNIIRGTLILYTQSVSRYYGIPMEEVWSGYVWDEKKFEWEDDYTELPTTEDGKLLLVPKVIVRNGLHMRKDEFFNKHLMPSLEKEELDNPSSKLVHRVKEGEKVIESVDRDKLKEHYGTSKSAISDLSATRPAVLSNYKDKKKSTGSLPLSHSKLSAVTGSRPVNYRKLLRKVLETPFGADHAHAYHRHVEALFSAMFYPELSFPVKENEINEGRKRIDIRYTNTSRRGFFSWLRDDPVVCRYVYVECKNYARDIANPELDQIASRFSSLRSEVGILTCRSFENKDLFLKRCRDTALAGRGYIFVLDDGDLKEMVNDIESYFSNIEKKGAPKSGLDAPKDPWWFPKLHERFSDMVS
ncbi:hypothetical protein GCM10023224_26710 [Streptomonospora halophila]|uniref:Restriction endonuclease n=1 Tax=Streptomonospora halophila TaxID=427369 RepID=A0ABP9GQ81_9ACTN